MSQDRTLEPQASAPIAGHSSAESSTPGRRTQTESEGAAAESGPSLYSNSSPLAAFARGGAEPPADDDHKDVHATAQRGVGGAGRQLPHLDAIQRSFGKHDVSGVSAHVGGDAADASRDLGARAYAYGTSVAFQGSPDLHTAAHEAAHTVQQRAGVQLKSAVGEVGDEHEQHADAVADAVVAGRSAEPLLDRYAGGGGAPVVQRIWDTTTMSKRIISGQTLRTGKNAPPQAEPKAATLDPSFETQRNDEGKKRVLARQLKGILDTIQRSPAASYINDRETFDLVKVDEEALSQKSIEELRSLIGKHQGIQERLPQVETLVRLELQQLRAQLQVEGQTLAAVQVPGNDARLVEQRDNLVNRLKPESLELAKLETLNSLVKNCALFRTRVGIGKQDIPGGLLAQMGAYQQSLNVNADGLQSAPAFVLDQVFGKSKQGKGASAANLDVGVSEALIAATNLGMTIKDYVRHLSSDPKNAALVANLTDLGSELVDEHSYMYEGLKANRNKGQLPLFTAINEGRDLAGASSMNKIESAGGGGNILAKDTDGLSVGSQRQYLPPDKLPDFNQLDPTRAKWIADQEPMRTNRPDVAWLQQAGSLGAGGEGEVNTYSGPQDIRVTNAQGPSPLQHETASGPASGPAKEVAVAGKTTKAAGRTHLLKEYAAFSHLGEHRNLPKVHGMASVTFGKDVRPAMVMELVRGESGDKAMDSLRAKVDANEITQDQYWAAMQLIARRLVEVTEHLKSKGIAHNDIKPENFIIGEGGEPKLIDLGMHTIAGETAAGLTKSYAPDEFSKKGPQQGKGDGKSDLFMVGATMLAGAVGWQQGRREDSMLEGQWTPAKGLAGANGRKDTMVAGKRDGAPDDARDMRSEFRTFIEAVVGKGDNDKPQAQSAKLSHEQAKQLPFLAAQLGDERDALKTLASLVTAEDEPSWDSIKTRGAPRAAGADAIARNQAAANRQRLEAAAQGPADKAPVQSEDEEIPLGVPPAPAEADRGDRFPTVQAALGALERWSFSTFVLQMENMKKAAPDSYWSMVGALMISNKRLRLKITPKSSVKSVAVSFTGHKAVHLEKSGELERSVLVNSVLTPDQIGPGSSVTISVNGATVVRMSYPFTRAMADASVAGDDWNDKFELRADAHIE